MIIGRKETIMAPEIYLSLTRKYVAKIAVKAKRISVIPENRLTINIGVKQQITIARMGLLIFSSFAT
ncbi:MAG TPA: hypothetical protein PKM28_02045, partial [Tenuifilaceae bacterium]|nr:hypothetical protein [Tenuifilaceae bacterium]